MKRIFFLQLLIIFMVAMLCVGFVSCNRNDDSVGNLEEFIIGTWRSYKCVVYAQGERYDVEVSKNGRYSHTYFEFTFKSNGEAICEFWDVDDYGSSFWVKKEVCYTLDDNIVELYNESSPLTLMYDEDERALYFRYYPSSEGYGFLYLRK